MICCWWCVTRRRGSVSLWRWRAWRCHRDGWQWQQHVWRGVCSGVGRTDHSEGFLWRCWDSRQSICRRRSTSSTRSTKHSSPTRLWLVSPLSSYVWVSVGGNCASVTVVSTSLLSSSFSWWLFGVIAQSDPLPKAAEATQVCNAKNEDVIESFWSKPSI